MSYICKDCGIDTTPCTRKRGCRHAGRWEHYMVHDDVWQAAGMPPCLTYQGQVLRGSSPGFLCIGCLENRIGRRLRATDFTGAPINDPDDPWHTPRLRLRLTCACGVGVMKIKRGASRGEAASKPVAN